MNRRLGWLLVLALALTAPACAMRGPATLQKVAETKALAIGYREASPPFSFIDREQKPAGYSVDLCTRIAEDIRETLKLADLKLQWVKVTPEDRIPALVDGRIDLECGTTTNTLGRQEQVDFSHLTFVDGGSFLVRADSGVRQLSDLVGKKIGVIPGTTTEKALREWMPKNAPALQLVSVKEHPEGLAALENGQVDAYASERVVLIGLGVTSRNPRGLALVDEYISYDPYAFMVRRGDAPFRLAVNRALSRIYRSGDIFPIYERWFGALGRPTPLLLHLYLLHALPD
jgi:glutamate/aspartate transport system substrate-binding protein